MASAPDLRAEDLRAAPKLKEVGGTFRTTFECSKGLPDLGRSGGAIATLKERLGEGEAKACSEWGLQVSTFEGPRETASGLLGTCRAEFELGLPELDPGEGRELVGEQLPALELLSGVGRCEFA